MEQISPQSGPATGSTLVTLHGHFSIESEIIFGNVKLKPFFQKPDVETEDEAALVDTLLCYSPFGTPGSSVQVYVKDGDCTSEPKYFLYTSVLRGNNVDEKVKGQNDIYGTNTLYFKLTFVVRQLRELGIKYNQLEQLVRGVIQHQQQQLGTNYRSLENQHAVHIIMKSVLLDIMQSKTDLQGYHYAKSH